MIKCPICNTELDDFFDEKEHDWYSEEWYYCPHCDVVTLRTQHWPSQGQDIIQVINEPLLPTED